MLDSSNVSYKPIYTITPVLLAQVEQIAGLRERILAAAVQVPWIPALQKDTRIRNAHSSTAIEGNPLTLEQVRAIEEGREIPATAQRARREVANYFAGLRFVEKNAQCGHARRDAEIAPYHRGRRNGPGKGRPLPDDSGAGGESRGAASGASAADDVGIAAVVEYTCGADFSDRELGHRASSV